MKTIKILIMFLIIFATVFLIYIVNIDKRITYLSLGDSISNEINSFNGEYREYSDYIANYLKEKKLLKKYVNNYTKKDYYIPELINDIRLNKKERIKNNEIGIKHILSEADLITLSIGNGELIKSIKTNIDDYNYQNIYKDCDKIVKELDDLINQIRQYNKKEIVFIGYYYPTEEQELKKTNYISDIYDYIYLKYENLVNKYDIKYINTNKVLKKEERHFSNSSDFYTNKEGQKKISDQIIKVIEKNNK